MNNTIRRQIVGKYVLSPKAIEVVRRIKVRQRLQEALGLTDLALMDNIRKNSDSLTKYAAIEVIMDMSDLANDEILILSKEAKPKEIVVVKELFG